tara:strand:- start:1980 stop:2165 length:186 start_codon:yes stop_codon:yes gene_type:complete
MPAHRRLPLIFPSLSCCGFKIGMDLKWRETHWIFGTKVRFAHCEGQEKMCDNILLAFQSQH